MGALVYAYLLTVPVLVALDLGWIGFLMKDFYQSRLAHLLAATPSIPPGILFYLLYPVGIFYFVVSPAWQSGSFSTALFSGAFFGFMVYAVYNLTNLATLNNWPLSVGIVDSLWGAVLGAVLGGVGYQLLQFFSK